MDCRNQSDTSMPTHRFNHPNDPTQGGSWFADNGRRICDWSWNGATKTVSVTIGMQGRHIDLSAMGEQLLTPEELRDRLPQVALEVAQQIAMGKPRPR